jgi:hypothetical protein
LYPYDFTCASHKAGVKPEELKRFRAEYIARQDEALPRRVQELYIQLSVWMVRFESELMDPRSKTLSSVSAVLTARSKLVLTGMLLANTIHNLLATVLLTHINLGLPFRKEALRPLCMLVESLKVIQGTFHRRSTMVAENLSHMMGQTQFTMKRVFLPLKNKLDQTKSPDDFKLDAQAAVNLTMDLLNSAPTVERMTVLELVLSVSQMNDMVKVPQSHEHTRAFIIAYVLSHALCLIVPAK